MSAIAPTKLLATVRRLGLPRRTFVFLFLLNLLGAGLDLLGIVLLLPILEIIQAGGGAAVDKLQGHHWTLLRHISAQIGFPIGLGFLLMLSFAFVLARQVVRYFAVRYAERVQRNMANSIRLRVFGRFLRAETVIQDASGVGSVISLLQTDLRRALDVLLSITQTISLVAQIISYFVGLFLLSPAMCVICAILVALVVLLTRGQFREIKMRGDAMSNVNRLVSTFMIGRLKRARLIRLSGTEKAEAKLFGKMTAELSEQELQQKMLATRVQYMVEPGVVGAAYLLFFVGAQVLGLGLERLGLFAILLIKIMPLLRTSLAQYGRIVGMMPSLEKLDAFLLEMRQASESAGGPLQFERLDRGISFKNVSFSYKSERVPALQDVSLEIPAYCLTALVGPSGAGKSTLIDLLPRLRDPTAGEIQFDGVPIQRFSTVSLRRGIAFVSQSPEIFDISVAEHIRYGKEDATEEEIRRAAELAGALEFIERLPQGFDTQLGDGASRLSGGQRQRLDIARALVRSAPILILDEPTSAVDPEAEADFRDVMISLRETRKFTIIVIAHRLSTIFDADQIIVLDGGSVTERGTHDQLLRSGGWYSVAHSRLFGMRSSA